MPSNHMKDRKRYRYRYADMQDAGYKKKKQTKSELMKALNDIYKREQNPQTATGPNYSFLDKWNEDWLEPKDNASE